MAQEHLQRREGGYYFRQRIHADLRVHYGQREIVHSLRTSRRRAVKAAVYEQAVIWSRDFARVRAAGQQTVPRASGDAYAIHR
jgi:hypothetical protein